jgi:hypothetical protein
MFLLREEELVIIMHIQKSVTSRRPNNTAKEEYSLCCYGDRVLLKITHIRESRSHCVGRGGRILSNEPKSTAEIEARQRILYHYFVDTHHVKEEDIEFHPAFYNPPSIEQVIYVFVPNDVNSIERVRYVVNSYGLHCYKEPVPAFPPRNLDMAI